MKEELQMLAEKIWAGHKGMCLGGLGGVLLATCILLFVFWNMLFVCLLGGIGLFIGVNADREGDTWTNIKNSIPKHIHRWR